jgi:hypothetical protein
MRKRTIPIKPLLPKATQDMKDTIIVFFNTHRLNAYKTCKMLDIPITTIRTLTKTKKQYISYKVANILLKYIDQWQKL